VFIGGYDNEHQKTPIFKVHIQLCRNLDLATNHSLDCRFWARGGDSSSSKQRVSRRKKTTRNTRVLGSRKSLAPPSLLIAQLTPSFQQEQYDESNRRGNTRRYGTATNVWQIGKVLYNLICRGRTFDSNAELFRIVVGNKKPRTMGHHILEAPYSVTLRKTILTCLAFSPPTRPTPRSLVRLVDQGIVACDTVAEGLGPIGDANIWMTGYQEPTELSAAWYSDPEPRVDEDDVETG
jgi:hypothetical protein